jgi:putative transposase
MKQVRPKQARGQTWKTFLRHIERALANAVCERFLGSVRRACLDHFLILHEKHLHRLLRASAVYFNQARPHQGLGQPIPQPLALSASPSSQPHHVRSIAVLGGLRHDYQRAA